MPTLTDSIEADVPPEFADREWGAYMVRQFYEGQSRLAAEVSDEFEDGIVRIEPRGLSTKITVELQMESAPGADPDNEYSRARERVERVLEGYRRYVQRRCEETHCKDR